MTKNLSARIAEKARIEKLGRGGKNRAAFLAQRVDIEQALNDGWSVKIIWETLVDEGKISFSYQAFRGYVNRLILSATKTEPKIKKNSDSSDKVAEAKKQKSLSGFTFQATPKKEDLL